MNFHLPTQRRENAEAEGRGAVGWSELQLGSFNKVHKTSDSHLVEERQVSTWVRHADLRPPDSHIETLPPNATVYGGGTVRYVIKVERVKSKVRGRKSRALVRWGWALYKKRKRYRRSLLAM